MRTDTTTVIALAFVLAVWVGACGDEASGAGDTGSADVAAEFGQDTDSVGCPPGLDDYPLPVGITPEPVAAECPDPPSFISFGIELPSSTTWTVSR